MAPDGGDVRAAARTAVTKELMESRRRMMWENRECDDTYGRDTKSNKLEEPRLEHFI